MFLQDNPTKASWDSLFIDGTYTNRDGVEASKNFLQNKITSSLSFEGSALQALLEGTDSLPAMEESIEDEETGLEETPTPVNPKGRNVSQVKKPVAAAVQKQSTPTTAKAPAGSVRIASPSKINTTALTRPAAPVEQKKVAKKKTSTKDAFAAIGLNVK